MRRSIVLCFLLTVVTALPALRAEKDYKGLIYATPSGWTSGLQEGQFLLVPTDMTEETAVVVVLFGVEKLGGRSFGDWFRARLASDLAAQGKLLQDSPLQSGAAGSLQTLSTGRTIQTADGGTRLNIYHALSDGRQAGLAMVVTASDAGIQKYQPGIQAILASLSLAGVPPMAKPGPSGPSTGGPSSGSAGTKNRIMPSDLVGHWSHSTSSYADYVSSSTGAYAGSSTIAYGQGYDFAADGTYKYDFTGIWDGVYVKEKDSGTWSFEGDRLVIRSRERGQVKKFQFIELRSAPDGTTFMTILPESYPPTEGNVGLYGEKFVRTAKK